MKIFFKNLILFSVIPLLLLIVIDCYLRNINTVYTAKYDGLMKIKDSVEVIFLGNSHANYGVDPSAFNNFKTYNLANVSQLIYFDRRLLEKVLSERVSNLKYVFISIDYHSLYSSDQGMRNVWTYYAYGIKYKNQNYTKEELSPFLWGYTPKVSISLIKKDIIRHFKYGKIYNNFDVEDGVNIQDSLWNGFLGFTGQDESLFNEEKFKARIEEFEEKRVINERQEIIDDLVGFIKYLRENGIKPILFTTPTYSEYNQYLNHATIIQNKVVINKICEEFKIQYWDYMKDSSFTKNDFFNPDHLNKNGAKKFSSILNNRLSKLDREIKKLSKTENNMSKPNS